MSGHEQIDALHLGRPHVVCVHRVGEVIVDTGPAPCHETVVAGLGGRAPRAILLTHVHLDHAGGAGLLVRRWPEIEVWVHERGVAHLVDPSRLIASATRIYGEDMERLWGEIAPVPQRNVRVLRGGETIGPWRIASTPGHAQHHVAFLHQPSGTAFTGDVAGVRIGGGLVLPPTPPPDIDLEAWEASLRILEAWRPERLALTHFGVYEDVAAHLGQLREALRRLGEESRRRDAAAFAAGVRSWIAERAPAEEVDAYLQAMPPDSLFPGLDRYWRLREEREAAAARG